MNFFMQICGYVSKQISFMCLPYFRASSKPFICSVRWPTRQQISKIFKAELFVNSCLTINFLLLILSGSNSRIIFIQIINLQSKFQFQSFKQIKEYSSFFEIIIPKSSMKCTLCRSSCTKLYPSLFCKFVLASFQSEIFLLVWISYYCRPFISFSIKKLISGNHAYWSKLF